MEQQLTGNNKLLVIEDETSVAKQLKWGLRDTYEITTATDAKTAWHLVSSGVFNVLTLDLGLPPQPDTPQEGLKLLERIHNHAPHIKVIVITGNDEPEIALQAVNLGAADFCSKPIDLKILGIIIARTFRLFALEETNRKIRQESIPKGALCQMLGASDVMRTMFDRIIKVSRTDFPILITGESGTGKEVVANTVHYLSPRRDKDLVIINCGAIPDNLIESELFGHEKGAFTGAVSRKIGKFEQANTGTIFLDEIGELPLTLQVKLLRVLQENTVERIGGNKTIKLNVRILAATNIDLKEAASKNTFRQDLFYRLNVVPIKVPPLRDRDEDVIYLAHHFLKDEAANLKMGQVTFSSAAITALSSHSWPGNVRELQNRIRRAISTAPDRTISQHDLDLTDHDQPNEINEFLSLKEARERSEKQAAIKALILTNYNITKAAKLLQTSRPTLHELIKKYELSEISINN